MDRVGILLLSVVTLGVAAIATIGLLQSCWTRSSSGFCCLDGARAASWVVKSVACVAIKKLVTVKTSI